MSLPPSDARANVAASRTRFAGLLRAARRTSTASDRSGRWHSHISDRDHPGFVVLVIQVHLQTGDVPPAFPGDIDLRPGSDLGPAPGQFPARIWGASSGRAASLDMSGLRSPARPMTGSSDQGRGPTGSLARMALELLVGDDCPGLRLPLRATGGRSGERVAIAIARPSMRPRTRIAGPLGRDPGAVVKHTEEARPRDARISVTVESVNGPDERILT